MCHLLKQEIAFPQKEAQHMLWTPEVARQALEAYEELSCWLTRFTWRPPYNLLYSGCLLRKLLAMRQRSPLLLSLGAFQMISLGHALAAAIPRC